MTDINNEEDRLKAARELVIPANKTVSSDTVALDAFLPLLAEINECKDNIKFWQTRLARSNTALAALMGDSTKGTIAGLDAVVFEPTARFSTTEFKKKYPNLARAYTHTVPKEEVDVEALRLTRPEVYAEFQVRPMRVVWEPPGANGTP